MLILSQIQMNNLKKRGKELSVIFDMPINRSYIAIKQNKFTFVIIQLQIMNVRIKVLD